MDNSSFESIMSQIKESDMYVVKNNKVVPNKAAEMEWILRFGTDEEVLKNRLHIAHIVNLYCRNK
ncbi:hypothetical protein ABD91_00605 [Lysinibacillus sphaericus]|uniref:hypothetical protein n=1 Tax=Lysinibacillus sphaericus TaxID=1421 RepID=UPI0018CF2994|nr:hypothetical protein [Lysinibacillus sphaericus]MBG9689428.1 hypothetical protein [Lysinibacillus sphaericus]